MMDTHTHTPGPWAVVRYEHALGVDSLHIESRTGSIGSVSTCNVRDEHDARLIAAAPDMLDALREVLHMLCCDSDLETVTGAATYEYLEGRVREVVERATGQSTRASASGFIGRGE